MRKGAGITAYGQVFAMAGQECSSADNKCHIEILLLS